ncbi:hypothetical protein ZWY2020_049296 [Hordeum vulgare]|nr:hypothetical protein ZWY2020_049296 [Hordeum vulgare]
MEGLDVDDGFQRSPLNPTEVDAATYYRHASGETLTASKFIHAAEISGEPKDLAADTRRAAGREQRRPVLLHHARARTEQTPEAQQRGRTGPSKTTEISHAGGKVGEVKNPLLKKKGKSTGWVMEEYRALPRGHHRRGVKVFADALGSRCFAAAAKNRQTCFKNRSQRSIASMQYRRGQPPILIRRASRKGCALPHHPSPPHRFSCRMSQYQVDDLRHGPVSCSMEDLFGLQVDETLGGSYREHLSVKSREHRTASPLNCTRSSSYWK